MMDESRLNGTRAGDGSGGGAPDVDAARLREIKLLGFLRELERQQGRMAAAALLGLNYKTVVRALDDNRVTDRVADALELLLGGGGAAELAGLRREVAQLAERVAALEECGAAPSVAAVVGEGQGDVPGESGGGQPGKPVAARTKAKPGGSVAPAPSQPPPAAPSVAGLGSGPARPYRPRRVYPELVTLEPAGDDPEVFGDAWPLVAEWRELRARHPFQGRSLSWLIDHERLLTLELAMLEEHRLTLPPEKQPVQGPARRDHTRWRWKALYRTQVSIQRRRLLRWLRRFLTLGLWRK